MSNSSSSNSDLPILTHHVVDKSQVPSIEQKRMLAFINHFILNTVDFLNKFIVNCETKFIEFDTKLQKVESSLIIVESKLASIPDVNDSTSTPNTENASATSPADNNSPPTDINANSVPSVDVVTMPIDSIDETNEIETPIKGIKISDDIRYKKYFKMMQMGVPAAAVKIKMHIEGFDGNLLDDPNRILEDGVGPEE